MNFKQNKVVVFIDWFLPGYKAGGPIRSVANIIDHLGSEFEFYIITSDRDLGDSLPYENIVTDQWQIKKDYNVIYLSAKNRNKAFYRSLLADVSPKYIYLNSIFSFYFSILPVLIFNSSSARILLSPRGMLGENSLKIKSLKKKIFLFIADLFKFYRKVSWIASNETERQQIVGNFGEDSAVRIAPNLPARISDNSNKHSPKQQGELSLLFIGRISPIKNVDFLISLLAKANRAVNLTIVGPIEDVAYWNSCLELIENINSSIVVNYLGEKSPNEIHLLFSSHHCLVSASSNENYGHSIVESLSCGCPVIVSEHTPWNDLAPYFAGFSIELSAEFYIDKIQFFADMDNDTYLKYKEGAFNYFKKKIDLDIFRDNYREIFS